IARPDVAAAALRTLRASTGSTTAAPAAGPAPQARRGAKNFGRIGRYPQRRRRGGRRPHSGRGPRGPGPLCGGDPRRRRRARVVPDVCSAFEAGVRWGGGLVVLDFTPAAAPTPAPAVVARPAFTG